MLRTPLCDLLGIELPIFAAPMGLITGPELAGTVSEAGGLGVMSFNGNPPPVLRAEIERLRSLTDKPFGVNVLLDGPDLPFPVESVVEACIGERVPVLSTFWGDPEPYVAAAHAAGVKVMHQVGSVGEAERAVRGGVDVIVAQGVEAGGHVAGTIAGMVLVPRVVDAVSPVPVVAAGGIADARGAVAALALGAQGVVLGTRLIATPEAHAHALYKQKLLAASEEETVLTTLFGNGWPEAPHRTLRTPFVERWLPEEKRGSAQRADEPVVGETKIGGQTLELRRFMGQPPTPDATGDLESMDFLAGQSVGLVREVKPAADVIRELLAEASHIVGRLSAAVDNASPL